MDSFSFECRGCTRMKELEVELEQLRLFVVATVGREQVGCARGSGDGTLDDKVGGRQRERCYGELTLAWEEAERG